PVLNALNQRGLMYLDSGSTTRSIAPAVARELKMTYAMATLTLDERASRKDIDRKFGELERRARRQKQAIGIASPYPVSLERIANWTRQLRARGFVLAPVSALTRNDAAADATAAKP
ncbi:MAG: divergent polysaccharide deacetylase family protein, partial [Alphaproteobacteria bacterium]|nr:divergent polysaccharide deacetylase family protein [Alphaproteobacteria bacterium]